MLTVACVFVRGHVPFTVEYVVRLGAMVRRHLDRPHQFVCLTDHPEIIPRSIETIVIPSPGKLKGWWSKLEAFAPDRFTGRVLYLDLDTLVVAPLDPIVDYPAVFALAPHAGTFEGKPGLRVVKRFNSSVMVWDEGSNSRLFTNWAPSVATRLHGDQDWIGEEFPEAQAMPARWFPRISEINGGDINPDAKVILVKKPKNVEAAQRWEWFKEAWA